MSDTNQVETPTASLNPSVPVASGMKEYPGQTLGVVALVLSFFMQIPALIMGIIAWNWSNRAGVPNTPAKISVFVSIGLIVLAVLALIGWTLLLVNLGPLLDESFLESL